MEEKKKIPKTAVLAFVQGLSEMERPSTEQQPFKKSNTFPTLNGLSESQMYVLPSGKNCRFILKTVDSKQCVVWKGNARQQEHIDKTALEDLKTSISVQGQLVPALVRPNKGANKGEFAYEIIFGSRRLKACQELNQPIKVMEADLSNEDALFFMEAENSFREDLSFYERAVTYNKWLETKIFITQDELAQKLGISKRWLIKLLGFLKIPSYIIDSLPNLKDLTYVRVQKLLLLFNKYSDANAIAMQAVHSLKLENPKYNGDELFEKIFSSFSNKNSNNEKDIWEEKDISDNEGEKIITIKSSASGKIKLEVSRYLSAKKTLKLLDGLEKLIKKI